MGRPRGRPALSDLDRMELEGRYLHARSELARLNGRLPSVAEVADHMEVSARTVTTIRAGMRAWRQATAAALGWEDWSAEPLHPADGATSKGTLILGGYAAGEMTTAEAADELASLGLPADERELRRWRAGRLQPE